MLRIRSSEEETGLGPGGGGGYGGPSNFEVFSDLDLAPHGSGLSEDWPGGAVLHTTPLRRPSWPRRSRIAARRIGRSKPSVTWSGHIFPSEWTPWGRPGLDALPTYP